VGAAVAADADQLDLVGVGTTELEIALTHKIVEHVPSAERVLLCVTGTEATFHAVRLARAVTRRRKIVKFQGCFHGANDYLLANVISPREKLGRHDPRSAGMLPEVLRETLVAEFNDLDAVTSLFEAYRGDIAAVIVEPIPHNIGAILPQPGFLEGVRSLTREHGVILIFDEVITGFRHGLGGYQADLESPPI
jgi:glutamate-1-semialdehyde 2,1-aminomutase